MLAGPLQRIQFWVCLLIESWLTLVGSNSLELANLLAAQFFKKELSLTMSVSEKVVIPKEEGISNPTAKNPTENAKVPLSCAAEARNTLPAAFSLVEKATGPGSRIMQASLTRREYDC